MASKTFTQASIFLAPTLALFMSGYSFASSQNLVNHFYTTQKIPPRISVPLFVRVFYTGSTIAVPCSLLSGLMSLYLAYLSTSSSQTRLFLIAGLSVLSSGLWTGLVMAPGIGRLIEMSKDERRLDKSEQTLEHEQLMRGWVWRNFVRTGMYAVGGGVGLWAAVFG